MGKLTSLEKALRALEAVAKARSIGLRELAAELGFAPATVHRLLAILTACRYLTQDPETKKYRPSLKLLELGASVRDDLDLITVARPHMTALMGAASETVNLALFDGAAIVYVDQVANTNSFLRMFTRVGARVPLHCTGVGKACLAGMPNEAVTEYWSTAKKESYTKNTITDEPRLGKDLETIRQLGYSVDDEEMEIGVRCVAAAIRQDRGQIIAAVSISGPSSRLTTDRVASIGKLVRQTADRISFDLGYLGEEVGRDLTTVDPPNR